MTSEMNQNMFSGKCEPNSCRRTFLLSLDCFSESSYLHCRTDGFRSAPCTVPPPSVALHGPTPRPLSGDPAPGPGGRSMPPYYSSDWGRGCESARRQMLSGDAGTGERSDPSPLSLPVTPPSRPVTEDCPPTLLTETIGRPRLSERLARAGSYHPASDQPSRN